MTAQYHEFYTSKKAKIGYLRLLLPVRKYQYKNPFGVKGGVMQEFYLQRK